MCLWFWQELCADIVCHVGPDIPANEGHKSPEHNAEPRPRSSDFLYQRRDWRGDYYPAASLVAWVSATTSSYSTTSQFSGADHALQ